MLNLQEAIYPANYNKLRFLENHDQPRIASFVPGESDLINFTAFLYFLKGTTLIYAGQEFENDHLPSLFEREPIDRDTGKDLSPLMARLRRIKGMFGGDDWFRAEGDDSRDVAVLRRGNREHQFLGVFSLKSNRGEVTLDLADGSYENLIDGEPVECRGGTIRCEGRPVILKV